jgi:hypothetical protein
VGLGDDYRKVPLGVMFTRKDHPKEGEIKRYYNKMTEEKPRV